MMDKYNEIGIPTEVEADGFTTRAETLERINANKAKPMTECVYPRCEECDKYHGHYCTVSMVVSKQDYITFNDKINDLMKRVLDLENLVVEELISPQKARNVSQQNDVNYTWDDYFKENQ